jgi:hypothetical protein
MAQPEHQRVNRRPQLQAVVAGKIIQGRQRVPAQAGSCVLPLPDARRDASQVFSIDEPIREKPEFSLM